MTSMASEETNLSGSSTPNANRPGNLFPDKIDRFLDVVAYSPGKFEFLHNEVVSNSIALEGLKFVMIP